MFIYCRPRSEGNTVLGSVRLSLHGLSDRLSMSNSHADEVDRLSIMGGEGMGRKGAGSTKIVEGVEHVEWVYYVRFHFILFIYVSYFW